MYMCGVDRGRWSPPSDEKQQQGLEPLLLVRPSGKRGLDCDTEREANKKKRPFVQTKLALTTLHSRAVYVRPDGGARQSGRDTLRQRSHAK